MAKDNAYMTIAEVYRNREHSLIRELQKIISAALSDDIPVISVELLEAVVGKHLATTGRASLGLGVPVIIPPVSDARKELLALLGPSEDEQRAFLAPVPPRTRKVRADKGKPRGPRKAKVVN